MSEPTLSESDIRFVFDAIRRDANAKFASLASDPQVAPNRTRLAREVALQTLKWAEDVLIDMIEHRAETRCP